MVKPPYSMPFTRVELCALTLLDGVLCVLLGRRGEAPFKGQWALPGGVLRIDLDSNLEQAAQRVAQERLGCQLPYLRQQCCVGGASRDPRAAWSLAIVYRALAQVDSFQPQAGKRLEELQWRAVGNAMLDATLAFDHHLVIAAAVTDLRREVEQLEVPFEYLPAQFTLAELQQTCEMLLGHRLDKSSFRRRIDERKFLIPVEGVFKTGGHRPAQLYQAAV